MNEMYSAIKMNLSKIVDSQTHPENFYNTGRISDRCCKIDKIQLSKEGVRLSRSGEQQVTERQVNMLYTRGIQSSMWIQ